VGLACLDDEGPLRDTLAIVGRLERFNEDLEAYVRGTMSLGVLANTAFLRGQGDQAIRVPAWPQLEPVMTAYLSRPENIGRFLVWRAAGHAARYCQGLGSIYTSYRAGARLREQPILPAGTLLAQACLFRG